MDDIVVKTLEELIKSAKQTVANRYVGHFEFEDFKKFLVCRQRIYCVIYWLFLVIALLLPIRSIRFISLTFNVPDLLLQITKITIGDGVSFLIAFTLVLFSIRNLWTLKDINKYLKIMSFDKITKDGISWQQWDFQDIILKDPVPLGKKLSYHVDGKHVLNLLCMYPDGGFGWLGFTNDERLRPHKGAKIWNTSDFNKMREVANFIPKNSGEIKIYLNKNTRAFMKRAVMRKVLKNGKETYKVEGFLIPAKVVGLRVRSSIDNNCIKIKRLKLQ